jgi:hypothetical protein
LDVWELGAVDLLIHSVKLDFEAHTILLSIKLKRPGEEGIARASREGRYNKEETA